MYSHHGCLAVDEQKRFIAQDSTLAETNIAPENGWFEDEISFRDGLFQRPCSFQGVYLPYPFISFYHFNMPMCMSVNMMVSE